MEKFAFDRRQFLLALASAGISPLVSALPFHSGDLTDSQQEIWISAQGNKPDRYSLGWIKPGIESLYGSIESGFRGHGLAQHPTQLNKVIMFSRRPGTMGIEVDLHSGRIVNRFESVSGRHQNGHGCFSADGSLLFVSESESKTGIGKISVLETEHYQSLGEIDSHGIGPHEIKLMPDTKTLVVANGGLHQSLVDGQDIFNLDTMRSSLSYVDIDSGKLISEYRVPETKASIRHLDLAPDGTIAIAMQVQRAAMNTNDIIPLGAIQKPGKEIELLAEPDLLITQMNDYMGSVAVNSKNRVAGFSSPRGNVVAFWHMDSLQLLGYHAFHDACGVAVTRDQQRFVLTNSSGQVRQLSASSLEEIASDRKQFPEMQWDNHLSIVAKHSV